MIGGELGGGGDDVEVGEGGFDHDYVGSFVDVPDLREERLSREEERKREVGLTRRGEGE